MALDTYQELIRDATRSPDYWREAAVTEFVADISRRMSEAEISRTELAKRLGTSKSYVTKLLSESTNFTLDTMVRLSIAVEGNLRIHVGVAGAVTHWIDEPFSLGALVALGRRAFDTMPALTTVTPAVAAAAEQKWLSPFSLYDSPRKAGALGQGRLPLGEDAQGSCGATSFETVSATPWMSRFPWTDGRLAIRVGSGEEA